MAGVLQSCYTTLFIVVQPNVGESNGNRRVIELLRGGKATKRSRYGVRWKDIMTRTDPSGQLCGKSGLLYHVVDSEMKWHYLPSYEARDLVENSRRVKTVLTFSVKHSKVRTIFRQTMKAIEDWDRVGLNLVVGNPAFLSLRERGRPVGKLLSEIGEIVHREYPDVEIFIGTEGIARDAAALAAENGFIPFLLLDKGTSRQFALLRDEIGRGRVALYFPYLISENYPRLLRDILFRLAGYILRRGWIRREISKLGYEPVLATLRAVVQEKQPLRPELLDSKLGAFLERAASTLVAYGKQDAVTKRLRLLAKGGFDTIVGLPVKESDDQILLFGECVRKASGG